MSHLHPRARTAVLGAIAAALLSSGCAEPGEVVEACHDTPNRESNCSQYHSNWEPEWKEADAVLPATPRSEDLVPIDAAGGGPGFTYEVDKTTIKRGKDEVMRYTVLVRSGSGTVNIFREGIRCLTGEVRTYGYATEGSDAFRPLNSDWSPIAARGSRGYQDYLYESIMCDRNGYAWPVDEALYALTAQYTADGVRIERFCGNQQYCNTTGKRF